MRIRITTLNELVDEFDGFIIDLWGVIHDGAQVYPDAVQCLEKLNEIHKKVVFVSNTPAVAKSIKQFLAELHITDNLYTYVVSSGQLTYEFARKSYKTWHKKFGYRYYYIGPSEHENLLANLPYRKTPDVKNAEFVLATGLHSIRDVPEAHRETLMYCAKQNLPMVCVNPDEMIIRQDGVKAYCAGSLAKLYKELGGYVLFIGKPYSMIYRESICLLKSVPLNRITAIGDNLFTDIRGANNHSIFSILINRGVIQKDVQNDLQNTKGNVVEYCYTQGILPDALIPSLSMDNF